MKYKKLIINLAFIFFPLCLNTKKSWSQAFLVLPFMSHNKAENVHVHVQAPFP